MGLPRLPGRVPVWVKEVLPDRRIVLEWKANEPGENEVPEYRTVVTFSFTPAEDGRTKIEISEEGWRETPGALKASYSNCMGWSQMLAALKVWLEHGINLREGMYK